METDSKADSRDENAYAAPSSSTVLTKKKRSFTLVELAVVLAILFLLVGMLLPMIGRHVPEASRRTQCLNNCRQIALAMLNYESANGHFLPAYIADDEGTPMHSWRVLLLPYLEHNELYKRYSMDEPWDGPNNSKLHDEIVSLYRCPSSDSASYCCDYALITGEGTGFSFDKTISFKDISDGSSNTIMIAEIFDPGFHWMKPQDIPIDRFLDNTLEQMGTSHPGTRSVALFDGSTHSICTDLPQAELRKLVLIDDGEQVDIYNR